MITKEMSLLIVGTDQRVCEFMSAFLQDHYRRVRVVRAGEEISLAGQDSFDLVLRPKGDDEPAPSGRLGTSAGKSAPQRAVIRSGVSGSRFTVEVVAAGCGPACFAMNPFDLVLLQTAIERSELAARQVDKVIESGAAW